MGCVNKHSLAHHFISEFLLITQFYVSILSVLQTLWSTLYNFSHFFNFFIKQDSYYLNLIRYSLTFALRYPCFQRAQNIALSEPYGPATKVIPTSKYPPKQKNIIGHQSPKSIMGPNSQKEIMGPSPYPIGYSKLFLGWHGAHHYDNAMLIKFELFLNCLLALVQLS